MENNYQYETMELLLEKQALNNIIIGDKCKNVLMVIILWNSLN